MSPRPAPGEAYEQQHVHEVYEQIAPHFSATRHKAWPIVARFLTALPAGSVGLDVGCGNGKYLGVNRDIFIVGSDRSRNLVGIAGTRAPHAAAVVVADVLDLPHVAGGFDFVVCVAVVHHLSTRERRVRAVGAVLETLRSGAGRALIYVWALEQEGSRRGWSEGDEQDVMVPWVMRGSKDRKESSASAPAEDGQQQQQAGQDRVFHRYYHLYSRGELERDVEAAGGVVVDAGYEKDNWWVVAARQPP